MTGNELKRWREERRLTQMRLSFRLGVDVKTLQRWEAKADEPLQKHLSLALIELGRRIPRR